MEHLLTQKEFDIVFSIIESYMQNSIIKAKFEITRENQHKIKQFTDYFLKEFKSTLVASSFIDFNHNQYQSMETLFNYCSMTVEDKESKALNITLMVRSEDGPARPERPKALIQRDFLLDEKVIYTDSSEFKLYN